MKKAIFMLSLICAVSVVSNSYGATRLSQVFKVKKPIIAVVNITPLPGQEGFQSMDKLLKDALAQTRVLEEEGVDGVLFENPHGGFGASPEAIAAMSLVVKEAVKQSKKIIVGVEVLWHDPPASLAIAKASGAKFIRTDFWVDKMTADGKLVDEDPEKIVAYRKKIAADDVLILTDIQVKYGVMVDQTKTIDQSAKEAKEKWSDGVVVSGPKSGVPPDLEKVKKAKDGAGDLELIIGSGTSKENIPQLLSVADATIVGTSVSTGTGGVVVREKVKAYMDVVRKIRKSLKSKVASSR